jgi:glutathione S-transferase
VAQSVSAGGETKMSSKHILYDVPVSNNGARCRIIIYKVCVEIAKFHILHEKQLRYCIQTFYFHHRLLLFLV